MTVKELSQYYNLKCEIAGYEKKIAELEAKATDTSAKITGMPHISGTNDKVGNNATEAEYYRTVILRLMKRCNDEFVKLTAYIEQCDDSLTRQILRYRFVELMPWDQVAVKVGGNNTADGCRMNVKRFLKKK